MAEVFLGHRLGVEGFQRQVAIKTIHGHGVDREAVRLFLDEARAAATLEHGGIVRTIDLGFDDDTLYIVMEYVAGPPLSRILRSLKERGRALRPPLVAHLGIQVALALDYAHHRASSADGRRLALVHRDVSPHNILITRQGGVKLTDFGIARSAIQHHVTRTGLVRGKAAYMSPEQVRAEPLDGRSDLFALGLVLYEALTLRRPFERRDEVSSMRAVARDPIEPLRTFAPEVSTELAGWIERCLDKSPSGRPERAEVLARGLERCLAGHSPATLESGWSQLVLALFGGDEGGQGHEEWHPTLRETPSAPLLKDAAPTPATPSHLAEILVELSPPEARPGPPLSHARAAPVEAPSPSSLPGTGSGTGRRLTRPWPWVTAALLLAVGGLVFGLWASRRGGPRPAPLATTTPSAPAVEAARPAEVTAPASGEGGAPVVTPGAEGPAAPEAAPVRVLTEEVNRRPPKVAPSVTPPSPPLRAPVAAGPPPSELAVLEAQLRACEADDASPRTLVAFGESLVRASARLSDSARGARIARNARSSANLGDVAGLRRAYEDLAAATRGGAR